MSEYVSTWGTPNLYSGLGAVRGSITGPTRGGGLPSSGSPTVSPIPSTAPAPQTREAVLAARAKTAALARARAQAQARAKGPTAAAVAKATAKARAAAKSKGPPAWSNAASLRDADGKVGKAMSAAMKAVIDRLPLSSAKKRNLKTSPVSSLIEMARSNPQAIAAYISSVRDQGGSVTAVSAGDNPATLAAKLVAAASSTPSAAVKAAANVAVRRAGFKGFGTTLSVPTLSTSSLASFVGLAPALAMIAPITLPALQSIASGRVVAMPSVKAIVDAKTAAATTAPAMIEATPPAATEAAEEAAVEENKLLGLPPIVVYGAVAGAAALLALRMMRKRR